MSTRPATDPYYKKFINGDFGHSHAAGEFAVWALCVGLSGWLLSPVLAFCFVLLFLLSADNYWIEREVKQSLAMKRTPSLLDDLEKAPNQPNKFWTQDAIDDVTFPRKLRKLWLALSILYIAWLVYNMGLQGVFLK